VNTTFRVGRIGLSAVRRTLAISVIFLAAAGCGSSKAVSTTATAPKSAVTAAPAKAADSALPTVSGAAGAKPVITMPTSEPPTKLIINVLTEGTGAAVKAGQQIKVQYSGQIWKTGAQFDASWDRGAPIEFGIGTGKVIKGRRPGRSEDWQPRAPRDSPGQGLRRLRQAAEDSRHRHHGLRRRYRRLEVVGHSPHNARVCC
jgi:FKBP-type peptidyl-prolyl cis-trans isomerase